MADGYRLDAAGRAARPGVLVRRTRAMYDLLARGSRTGEQPWARLWAEGHGDHWGAATGYVAAHADAWRAALSGQ